MSAINKVLMKDSRNRKLTDYKYESILLTESVKGNQAKLAKVEQEITACRGRVEGYQRATDSKNLSHNEFLKSCKQKAAETQMLFENSKQKNQSLKRNIATVNAEIEEIHNQMGQMRYKCERYEKYKNLLFRVSPEKRKEAESLEQRLETGVKNKQKPSSGESDMADFLKSMTEKSIFLISHINNYAETIDDMNKLSTTTLEENKMIEDQLKSQIGEIRTTMPKLNNEVEHLKKKVAVHEKIKRNKTDIVLNAVGKKVIEVHYSKQNPERAAPTTLDKLSMLEQYIATLVQDCEEVPEDILKNLRQSKVIERRKVLQAQRLQTEWEKHEKKMQQCMKKVMCEPKKTGGRKLVYRHAVLNRKIEEEIEEEETPPTLEEMLLEELLGDKDEQTFSQPLSDQPTDKKPKTQKKLLGSETSASLRQLKREEFCDALKTAEQTARRENNLQQCVRYEKHMAAQSQRGQQHPVKTCLPPISKVAKTPSVDKASTATDIHFSNTVGRNSDTVSKYSKPKQQDRNIFKPKSDKNRTFQKQQARISIFAPPSKML